MDSSVVPASTRCDKSSDTDPDRAYAPVLHLETAVQDEMRRLIEKYCSKDRWSSTARNQLLEVKHQLRNCTRDAVSVPAQCLPVIELFARWKGLDRVLDELSQYRLFSEAGTYSMPYSGPGDVDVTVATDGYNINIVIDVMPGADTSSPHHHVRAQNVPEHPILRHIDKYAHVKETRHVNGDVESGRAVMFVVVDDDGSLRAVQPMQDPTDDDGRHTPAENIDGVTIKQTTFGMEPPDVERRYRIERSLADRVTIVLVAQWEYVLSPGSDGVGVVDSRVVGVKSDPSCDHENYWCR